MVVLTEKLATASAGPVLFTACLLVGGLLASKAAWAADKPAPAAKPPAANALSARDRQKVANLIAAFQKARAKPDKRDAIVEQIIEIGGPAIGQLLAVIEKEVSGQSNAYGQKFQKRAVILSRGKTDKIDLAELARLRAQVLDLKSQENLTKETIVSQADPAITRLSEMLVFDHQIVLDKSPELRPDRLKLLALGRYWEVVTGALLREQAAAKAAAGDQAAGEAAAGAGKAPSFEDYLQGEEHLAAQMAMPMDDSTRAVLASNSALAPKIDPEEARAILGCNLLRNLLGLAPLAIDLQLCAAARDHSQDMESLKFFAHISPVPGKSEPWDRARNFNTSASGENIYAGSTDGNQANLAWFHSPGHFKNMLGDHVRIGMGRSGVYFTELFGK